MSSTVAESSANGAAEQSPAAQLAKQHDEAHQPTVEEVPDEDDLPKTKTKAPAPLDVQSEDAFPALGGGPRPKAAAPTMWGASKGKAAANKTSTNGTSNGFNAVPTPPLGASRTSTPASGAGTPAFSSSPAPGAFQIPGQKVEKVIFTPQQLQPQKPIADVLRDINKRSKAKVIHKNGLNGNVIFEARGPTDESIRSALKEVAKAVGTKLTVKLAVPASSRAHIIGKQGSVIRSIGDRSGARIQVPRLDESAPAVDDDDAMVDVSIEGDAISAEMARVEILKLVKERTANVNLRLKEIPAEYFPFISGAHSKRVNDLAEKRKVQIRVPEYTTWSQQPPSETPDNEFPVFQPTPDRYINISGDREAALEAQAEIEAFAESLRRQITLRQLAINRGQHQFIVGNKSNSLNDFLAETGCSVILPPDSDDTEFLTITGPADQIEAGINKAMDLATSMQMASVDLSRQHMNAPSGPHAHARALTQYFQRRQAIEELERLYDAQVVLPLSTEGPVAWEVYSRDGKNTIKARSDILNLVQAHPPSRVRFVDVDPFFHQRIQSQEARLIQDEFGVHVVVPDEVEAPQVLLVYEGPTGAQPQYQPPRQRPSSADIAEFEKALVEAQKHILDLISAQEEIVGKTVQTPNKFTEKLRRFVTRDQQSLAEGTIPVRTVFGDARGKNADCDVALRGPSSAVDDLAAKIAAFVDEQKRDELERDYITSFDFPQKYANFLIGKQGENINKLRDEFDVDIKVDNGVVEVKGPKAKADSAKSRILNLGKKWEDETTHVLKIPAQYHRELIGAQGSQVNRLQDKYKVRVQFPRSARSATVEDDASVAGSDHGASKNRKQQAADEVIIKGSKKDADAAREDLLGLFQWNKDRSFTDTISVAKSQVPSLIGHGGREMDKLRSESGAQIDVPSANAEADADGRVELKIKGTKADVQKAKKLLNERAQIFDDTITKTIEVDKKHLRSLIGGGGSNIRKLVIEAGGLDDTTAISRLVRFPRAESDESTVRLEGHKDVVEKIYKAIETFVQDRDDHIADTIDVPTEKHRLLIGRGGETRRELESKFNVNIDIPKIGTGKTDVKIKGPSKAVADAKAHISTLIEAQKGETIQVPKRLHHAISDNGQFFRRLRNDHHVTVDHAGQQPPAKPQSASSRGRSGANGASLPLITDDASASDSNNYSWEVVDAADDTDSSVEGSIPWILSGSSENVAKAKSLLEKTLENASRPSATGYLILPDPKTYRLVIGPGGREINSIRKKTGCKIDVPKNQAAGEAIEIKGSKTGLEQAKDLILEAVAAGARN